MECPHAIYFQLSIIASFMIGRLYQSVRGRKAIHNDLGDQRHLIDTYGDLPNTVLGRVRKRADSLDPDCDARNCEFEFCWGKIFV